MVQKDSTTYLCPYIVAKLLNDWKSSSKKDFAIVVKNLKVTLIVLYCLSYMRSKIKQTLLLLISLISGPCIAGEYSDCILENMKGVSSAGETFAIKQACREKALPYVPEKCRKTLGDILRQHGFDTPEPTGHIDPNSDSLARHISSSSEDCINSCLNASYWSKHFGDCKEWIIHSFSICGTTTRNKLQSRLHKMHSL